MVGYPGYDQIIFWIINGTEVVFAFEILFGFFLQESNEQGYSQNLPLVQVSENYIKKQLIQDIIALLPLGEIG